MLELANLKFDVLEGFILPTDLIVLPKGVVFPTGERLVLSFHLALEFQGL